MSHTQCSSNLLLLHKNTNKRKKNAVESIKECNPHKKPKIQNEPVKAKSSTERSREYRLRKKLEKQQATEEKVCKPVKTNAERCKDYKLKRKLENERSKQAKTVANRCKDYRLRRKIEKYQESEKEESKQVNTVTEPDEDQENQIKICRAKKFEIKNEPVPEKLKPIQLKREYIVCNIEFKKRFLKNPFGFPCSVCDRLWFQKDLRSPPNKSIDLLTEIFPTENIDQFQVCQTCYKSLSEKKVPRLSRSNGFVYPEYPKHLPPLDIITERLVSPRIPFMQIRRLRFVYGSKGIIGQVINVPVDVDDMVCQLPRQLDDDYAFNVHIKRHLIHKTPYLKGMIKKSTVKAWLKYLLNKPLYRLYQIKIDQSFFEPTATAAKPHGENQLPSSDEKEDPIIEPISESPENINNMLLAKQHTLMWSEEKYLDMAPGMKQVPMSLIYDEHAEELSFPSIYLGEARCFSLDKVTPFMMATSEIRRRDRRGVKPEHVLYMAMKIMRLRLTESLYITFKSIGATANITRADIENRKFIENSIEQNLLFMRSIPNSVQYWMQRKKDVFAMIRQLGKPTLFLTLSASEYKWSDLLKILYKLQHGKEFKGEDPIVDLSSDERTTLVNEDPVTCCVYFDKLVDTIMFLLQSKCYSSFGRYRVKDFFKRIEFQQRGSPHAHILLWLENDPQEDVNKLNEKMVDSIRMVDQLCSVDPRQLEDPQNQTHRHTFTCYKRPKDEEKNRCRFGAPFWPVENTVVLVPMPKADGRRKTLLNKYADMHRSLEFEDFDSLASFLKHHRVPSYSHYLNVLRAGITRPRLFLKRTIQQRWMNSFNPWIANVLRSNMDMQCILEPYSCATYVVEYVNKTNRGISALHRELIKLRDDYPDKDYLELLKELGIKMLNSVEMSSQEAAWYLLNLHMSESSRQVAIIPTCWPNERHRVRKSQKQMDEEEIAGDSLDIWKEGMVESYERRPTHLESESLARFIAWFYKSPKDGEYKRRQHPKVIRYRNYDMSDLNNYKREMVLLHVPFRNEEVELLDQNKFLALYDEKEGEILEARQEFESDIDIRLILKYCKEMGVEEKEALQKQNDEFVQSKATKDEDFVQALRDGNYDDIRMAKLEKMSSVVRKRENVMSAEEYCKALRMANPDQSDLVLEFIYRIFDDSGPCRPLQIFLTGYAGCGKTFLVKLLMETANRFSPTQNSVFDAYIACASTGIAAAAINGRTVHSQFGISNSRIEKGLSMEQLNAFRSAFKHVYIAFFDECSMMGSSLLQKINHYLQQILHNYDSPFGGMHTVFIGDLRQLPPVCQTPIYQRTRIHFTQELVWQSLDYYPLTQVMRQADVTFSGILGKIGNGESLTEEETALIESRFVTRKHVDEHFPEAIRLFFRTADVNQYNNAAISGDDVVEYVAQDVYSGYQNDGQLASARTKLHKMKTDETGGLPYMLKLKIGKPYMIRVNIDVLDGLVNGAIGNLRYIERDTEGSIKRLWLSFRDPKIGKLIRAKCEAHVRSHNDLKQGWVPINTRIAHIQTNSKIISCKRTQFPLVAACAITIHKSQGATYDKVVYQYDKKQDQQLVYVAMSRVTSLEGLYLTHAAEDHKFYHARGQTNTNLQNEFKRLESHKLITIGQKCREFIAQTNGFPTALSLCTHNVQSLRAHGEDIAKDTVVTKVKHIAMTETWVENNESVEIPGFQTIAQFKRTTVRAGGVCIYQNENAASALQSEEHDLLKYNREEMKIKRMATAHDGVGDICAIETTIDGKRALLVSFYISPNTSSVARRDFFELNMMAYSPKAAVFEVVRREGYHLLPIILCGDLNLDLKSSEGLKFLEFMKDTFGLTLNNNLSLSTTRNRTCIDAVFTRHVEHLQTINFISYFSYHKPLLSITTTPIPVNA